MGDAESVCSLSHADHSTQLAPDWPTQDDIGYLAEQAPGHRRPLAGLCRVALKGVYVNPVPSLQRQSTRLMRKACTQCHERNHVWQP